MCDVNRIKKETDKKENYLFVRFFFWVFFFATL